MMFKFLSRVLVAAVLSSGIALAELPTIDNPHTIQPPPGAPVAATYFTVNNNAGTALEITGVSSDVADKAQLHLSRVVDDVATMEHQDVVTVPAGESLAFERGSYHVMLMGLTRTLKAGDSYELTLTTNAGDIALTVPVIESAGDMKMDSLEQPHNMDSGEMKMDHLKQQHQMHGDDNASSN